MTAPQLIIFMGVSGCGKSTVAQAYAKAHQLRFLDADDFHSRQAKEMMQQGQPLNDELRLPWINRMLVELSTLYNQNVSCSLAYSGLKAQQRKAFLSLPYKVTFIHLVLPLSEAKFRLNKRQAHFFSPSLIESQYDALEAPSQGEEIIEVDATAILADLIQTLPFDC